MAARKLDGPIPALWFVCALAAAIGILFALRSRFESAPKEPPLLISEFLAVNHGSLRDEDGDLSDWIEIHNVSGTSVNMEGWHLTDDFRNLRKWRCPLHILPPGGYKIVFASAKDRAEPNQEWHTNFKLQQKGQYLALVAPDGASVASDYFPKYPAQEADVSYGLRPETRAAEARLARNHAFFPKATPGTANAAPAEGHTAPILFSRQSGLYRNGFDLVLSSASPGARIFYTTNGAIPDPKTSPVFQRRLSIRATQVIRALALARGALPSAVQTASYIFPDQAANQTGSDLPRVWGYKNEKPIAAHYRMRPGADSNEVRKALLALPTVSIALSSGDLFDPATGIYANPEETGSSWEKPASFEWIPTGSYSPVQAECGLRIQGGSNRRPEETPKHSFRLVFKNKYGSSRAALPIFGEPEVFDSLILRAGFNNSWLHPSAAERRRGDYIRDEWMRETGLAMELPNARGTFVHLFLNGVYWGIYNAVERPSGQFLEKSFGHYKEGFDSRNGGKILEGDGESWKRLLERANRGTRTPAAYAALSREMDVTNFADFMLLNLYSGNADWDRNSNWHAARPRDAFGQFHFFAWDGERILEDARINTLALDDDQSPQRLFQRLRENEEFRMLFADRVQRHLFGTGALSERKAAWRFQQLARSIEAAIPAESARWGAYRASVRPYREGPYEIYTREQHWRPENERVLNSFFPRRGRELLAQLRAAGLYPSTDAPAIKPGTKGARLESSAAEIYYTLDGSDPRLPGGRLSGSAKRYENKPFPPDARVIARARAGNVWSARVEL